MKNGFLRIASVAPEIKIGDVEFNVKQIIHAVDNLENYGVEIAVFPELSLTGYTCGDLFHSELLLSTARKGLKDLGLYLQDKSIDIIVGLPISDGKSLYNCAALIQREGVKIIKKTYLPNYNEFYEKRWFHSGQNQLETSIFESHGVKIGIEICEDLWAPIPISCKLSLSGAEVIFNLSASNDLIGKYNYTIELIKQQSARCICAYAYASSGKGESSTDLVYSPKNIIAENGIVVAANDRWDYANNYVIADVDIEGLRRDRFHNTTFADCADINLISKPNPLIGKENNYNIDFNYRLQYREINPYPFVPTGDKYLDERCEEIIHIQCVGLLQRLTAIDCKSLVIGISGGLDSTLALLVAAKTFEMMGLDKKSIYGVTMPGFGTTGRTYNNAKNLINEIGATLLEISIVPSVLQHFRDINHDPEVKDITYENSQARERTQILMDLANQKNAIVLGTGDMSELALGWATFNGDQISMYGINSGVPKTLVKYLVNWFALKDDSQHLKQTLRDIIDTPISPELLPGEGNSEISQKTEELVGPYELHDFFLYYTLRYGFSPQRIEFLAKEAFRGEFPDEIIRKWLIVFFKRFFSQQFKRSCLPDGPKVGSVCLSPRGDWRMPSDANYRAWIESLK